MSTAAGGRSMGGAPPAGSGGAKGGMAGGSSTRSGGAPSGGSGAMGGNPQTRVTEFDCGDDEPVSHWSFHWNGTLPESPEGRFEIYSTGVRLHDDCRHDFGQTVASGSLPLTNVEQGFSFSTHECFFEGSDPLMQVHFGPNELGGEALDMLTLDSSDPSLRWRFDLESFEVNSGEASATFSWELISCP